MIFASLRTSTLVATAAAVLCQSHSATAAQQQLSNDPPSYFGGTDHQGYLDWLNDKQINTNYASSVYLASPSQANQGAAVHWKLQEGDDDDTIHIALATRATGWMGFGIGESGGMLGSDMMLWEAAKPDTVVDAHVVDQYLPVTDTCSQDWEFISSSTSEDGFLLLEARRKLDTGDLQDRPIVNDTLPAVPPHRLVAAWGDGPVVSYHGRSVARGAVRFYGAADVEADFAAAMQQNAQGDFQVRASNYEIPTDETTYAYTCFSNAQLLAQGVPNITTGDGLNIIGFQPVVTPEEAVPYVHHFVVSASYDASDAACVPDEEGEYDGFDNLAYVWAPGDGSFALPDFLGAPLMGESGFNSFLIEIHYDNPDGNTGIVDSSGVDFYFTSEPREHQLGILQIGDPWIGLFDQPIGEGLSSHEFSCPGACSETFLDEPVTVLREYQHMHKEGALFVNEQIRDGAVVRKASVEVWDFDQNGNTPVQQQPYEIKPGDAFRTSCYYNDKRGGTKFGLASNEEMCIAFLYYYPRKVFSGDWGELPWTCANGLEAFDNACFSSHEAANVSALTTARAFGTANCPAPDADEDDADENVNVGNSASPKLLVHSAFLAMSLSVSYLLF